MSEESHVHSLPAVMEKMRRGQAPPPPIAQLIGFTLVDYGPGWTKFELQADERHTNPMGTLHGGVLCDVADAAMGMAYASQLAEGESFTTLELKINFLRPVWQARLTAEAKVVHQGHTAGMVECEVFDEQRRLVAKVSSTCLTLRGQAASGR